MRETADPEVGKARRISRSFASCQTTGSGSPGCPAPAENVRPQPPNGEKPVRHTFWSLFQEMTDR